MLFLSKGSIAMGGDTYEKLEPCIAKIEAKMPKNWKSVQKKADEIPEYHYEGMKYDGPKGIYLLLAGDRDVDYRWQDREGIWHKKPFAKEAVSLWIMPSKYHESWKKFFIFKGHVTAPELYRSRSARVYGGESSYREPGLPWRGFEKEFPNAYEYSGTPEHTVQSWMSWKEDIKEALDACSVR